MSIQLKVGSKGELFLPKKIREKMNIKPGDKIFVEMSDDKMVIRKVDDLVDLFQDEPLTNQQTPDEIKKDIKNVQKEQFGETIGEK